MRPVGIRSNPEDPSRVKPLRIVAKLRNNRLIKLREVLGMTCHQAAEHLGVNYQVLIGLEGLKRSPIDHRPQFSGDRHWRWTPTAQKIADGYHTTPDWIWPEELAAVRRVEVSIEVDVAVACLEEPPTPEELASSSEESRMIVSALAALPFRERYVLTRRLGIGGIEIEEAEDIAEALGITKKSVYQYEWQAKKHARKELRRKGLKPNPGTPSVKAARVTFSARNNRLTKLREDRGWSRSEAASALGVEYDQLLCLERLEASPFAWTPGHGPSEWSPTARRIADGYGAAPAWLWPEEIFCTKIVDASAEVTLL